MGVRKALQSPLFRKIRAAKALGWEHTGGCTLFRGSMGPVHMGHPNKKVLDDFRQFILSTL